MGQWGELIGKGEGIRKGVGGKRLTLYFSASGSLVSFTRFSDVNNNASLSSLALSSKASLAACFLSVSDM